MASPVSLERFMEACRASLHPDQVDGLSEHTWVWKDLSLAGDDWWEFSMRLLRHLECEGEMEVDIYNYIPHEGNVPVFLDIGGKKKAGFPDLTLKDVHHFTKFWKTPQ